MKADFIDQGGVLCRPNTATKRMLIQGSTVGILEYCSISQWGRESSESTDVKLSRVRFDALYIALNARVRNGKSQLLVKCAQDARRNFSHGSAIGSAAFSNYQHERLQLCYDPAELDTIVETISQNTVRTPDQDGRPASMTAQFELEELITTETEQIPTVQS